MKLNLKKIENYINRDIMKYELYIFVNNYNYSDFESPIYTKEFVMIFKKQSSGYYLYDIVSLNYE